jgi:hypothetical protein
MMEGHQGTRFQKGENRRILVLFLEEGRKERYGRRRNSVERRQMETGVSFYCLDRGQKAQRNEFRKKR